MVKFKPRPAASISHSVGPSVRPSVGGKNFPKNSKSIFSTLGLDRDLGFSRGYQGSQGHWPHDDDDNEQEDNNEVEDNDNNKEDNNDTGISAMGLDRDLGISRVPS